MSVLKTLEIKFKSIYSITNHLENIKLNEAFHDYLLMQIDNDYVDYIAEQVIKPYSQYVIWNDVEQLYLWRISSFNAEATEKIVYTLMNKLSLTDNIILPLNNNAVTFNLKAKNYIHSATYKQLVTKYFSNNIRFTRLEFKFISPIIVPVNQENILPQTKTIITNLVAVWNLFAKKQYLSENELIEHLASQMMLVDYDLRYKPLLKNKQQFTVFTGRCVFDLANNIMAKKIIAILSEYAQYIGLGMHTDLGFGAVQIKLHQK